MNDAHDQRRDDEDHLITRLIDAEADDLEIETFCAAAAGDPELIHRLLLTHRQSVHLAAAMEQRLQTAGAAALAALPAPAPRSMPTSGGSSLRWTTWSGWATAAVICLLLLPSALSSRSVDDAEGTNRVALDETAEAGPPELARNRERLADEYLHSYLQADHVLGDLEPQLIETSTLRDGRVAVVYLRRIQEVAILDLTSVDPDRQPWVDENGTLSSDPRTLLRNGV